MLLSLVATSLVHIAWSANIKIKFFYLLSVDDQDVDGGGDCVHTLLLPTQHWLGRAKFVYIFIFYIYFQSPRWGTYTVKKGS